MARVTELNNGFSPIWIWDLTDRVGWGLRNLRPDVQLVQFAINKLIPKLGLIDRRKMLQNFGPGMQTFAPLAPLKPDGFMGTETANAINSYVSTLGSRDQAIDPVYPLLDRMHGDPTGGAFLTAFMKIGQRTMFRLNLDHLRGYGTMMDEMQFPPVLRANIGVVA
jgi:hypothetical protein